MDAICTVFPPTVAHQPRAGCIRLVHAHHSSWYSRSTDTSGKRMDDSINGSNYGVLNWDSPTRVPPYVSLASTCLIISCSWQSLSTLSSDHLPILIRLQMNTTSTPGLRRTYVNLKKANWDRYRQEVEIALSKRSFPNRLPKR